MNDFDQKAAQWDAKPVRVERAQAVAAGIKAALPLASHLTALEYGCGTGLLSFALQPYLGHITLADSSSGMLTVLREKIAAGNIQNMTPLQLDLMTDPLPAGFDQKIDEQRNTFPRYRVAIDKDHCINCGTCVDACMYSVRKRDESDPRRVIVANEALCLTSISGEAAVTTTCSLTPPISSLSATRRTWPSDRTMPGTAAGRNPEHAKVEEVRYVDVAAGVHGARVRTAEFMAGARG